MELPKRKRQRLINYDYSNNGAYFITICVKDKRELLWNNAVGAILNRPMLSEYGLVVEEAINVIPLYYPMITVDKYVIMPNHVHIILLINTNYNNDGRLRIAPTISTIIQQTKRRASKQIGISLWQKSFHDHIIRGESDYQKIWQYIDTNPQKWSEDCYYEV